MNGQMQPPATTPMFRARSVPRGSGRALRAGTPSHRDVRRELHRVGPPRTIATPAKPKSSARRTKPYTTPPNRGMPRSAHSTDALTSLQSIDAPKSLVLVSEGLAVFDGDEDVRSRLTVARIAGGGRAHEHLCAPAGRSDLRQRGGRPSDLAGRGRPDPFRWPRNPDERRAGHTVHRHQPPARPPSIASSRSSRVLPSWCGTPAQTFPGQAVSDCVWRSREEASPFGPVRRLRRRPSRSRSVGPLDAGGGGRPR